MNPSVDRDLIERGPQIGEVLRERLAVAQRDRADAHRAARHIGAGHPLIGGDESSGAPRVSSRGLAGSCPANPRAGRRYRSNSRASTSRRH